MSFLLLSSGVDDNVATTGDGLVAGTATVAAVGTAIVSAAGSSAGTSTATSVPAVVGSSAGTSTAAATGAATAAAVGASAGASTVTATGTATFEAVGASDGTSTVAALGTAVYEAVGAVSGSATADAVGELGPTLAVGDAAGTSTATAVSDATVEYVGEAAGTSTAAAVGTFLGNLEGDKKDLSLVLGKAFLRIMQNQPPTPQQFATLFSKAYETFAQTKVPTPILVGRRQLMEKGLLAAFATPGGTPKSAVDGVVNAFTLFWLGTPVPGGAVTAFLGREVMTAQLMATFNKPSTSQAELAVKLGRILATSTNLVQYVIAPLPPAFLV